MEKKKKKELGIVLLLLVAVVVMTVGFANYSQRLNITGNVTVKGSPWDVRYVANDITETTGTNAVSATNASVDNTDFSFTVTLNKPGDFYEATIKAHNYGTIGAQLTNVSMSALTAAQNNYLEYTVTVGGATYTATTSALSQAVDPAVALAVGADHPVKIKVLYKQPATADLLPSTDQTITVTGSLNYESVQ